MKLKQSVLAVFSTLASMAVLADVPDLRTTTPIKHVIVVIGENISFDALFGTYVPPVGQSVLNLLSQEIVKSDGTPGKNYARAVQYQGSNPNGLYTVDPIRLNEYSNLPQPLLTGVYNPQTLQMYGLIPDPRFASLYANGPYQITKIVDYNNPLAATGDPVHRFFQMWQQTAGTNKKLDLYTWVAATTGQGGDTPGVTPQNPGQGGEVMGFFNMATGDAPYFKSLAEQYALSDNYHQSIMGGTGANFFSIATGDVAVYNVDGKKAVPPSNQIENPNPLLGTANFYTRDGYAGGSYVNCSDPSEPGVAAILSVLEEGHRRSNCERGAYYLVNNYDTPYNLDGTAKALGADQFIYPPQNIPTIGESLSAKNVSWKWYTGGRDAADVFSDSLYTQIRYFVQSQVPGGTPAAVIDAIAFAQTQPLLYNSIGDPHNGSRNVVGGALRDNLKGLATMYQDIANSTLPAVSFVVPKNLDSGHPGFSTPVSYELFIKDLLQKVQANPELWKDTAILVTTDEGGGYFDTGSIQNLDFFGDGPRVPFLVISPYAKKGHVDHTYHDHASILKFIEHNWKLKPLSKRSRDSLPNPIVKKDNPYQPVNAPAIGDLMSLFNFGEKDKYDEKDKHDRKKSD
jgi:acid phosphatase